MADGDRLKQYSTVRRIGKGSYGEVFLVRCRWDKKQFVMKDIRLSSSKKKEREAAVQEASLLSQLNHPNIVSYRESFQDHNGVLHIVMGYCEGGDLCSRLKTYRGQLLAEVQVVEWFVQITLALQYLHDRNILHRDLKTQNIFLSKNNIIKVGDLGIARVLDASTDLAHTVIGTPYYMSPEQFAGTPYNHKSDIWALGCCLYEMASLRHAFTADNITSLMYRILHDEVPPLPAHKYSHELSSLVHSMLSRDAARRPSVHHILRMEYIRTHIRTFLDREKKLRGGQRRNSSNGNCKPVLDKQSSCSDGNKSKSCCELSPGPHPTTTPTSDESSAVPNIPETRKPDIPLPQSQQVSKPSDDGSSKDQSHLSGLSSARERRRRYRQESPSSIRGRIVLRSRSNEKLPQQSPSPASRVYHDRHVCTKTSTAVSHQGEDVHDEEEDKKEEVISLLDSTLHLPESRKNSTTLLPHELHTAAGNMSVRLKERNIHLRHELVCGLGEERLSQAMAVLASNDHDHHEDKLSYLIGREGCQQYISRLRELQLYECLFEH